MKKLNKYFLVLIFSAVFAACNINDPHKDYYSDYNPPAEPTGLVLINGDNRVDIYWHENREADLAGYNIYFSYEYDGRYELIGSTQSNYFIDRDVSNAETYFYAVTAYDYNGNESELSIDYAYATPRPEGFNQSVFDYIRFPDNAGYSFSEFIVVPYDDLYADFFFENYNGEFYLNVWDDSDIQDMGPTYDIYDIPFAPNSGWAPDKYERAKIGHTYVIWTWDNHFAKIRVKNITNDRVVFDWAYQLVEGEPQLKPKTKREPLAGKKLRIKSSNTNY